MSFLGQLRDNDSKLLVPLSISALLSIWTLASYSRPPIPKIIEAPSLDFSSPYPPDLYPGGKDIQTPYGKIRAYCFGPEDGEKLLFVHGITTCTPVWQGIIRRMASLNYRVCCFDLFGRGYSDSPDLPHDERLYISQIMSVMMSFGWTKTNIVGYSLGGCLGTAFATSFPEAVDKLILIAPAGLLNLSSQSLPQKLAITGWVPTGIINMLKNALVPNVREAGKILSGDEVDVTEVLVWQARNHKGFSRSYVSSFRCSPIFDQYELFGQLQQLKIPTYAIWGDNDTVVETQSVSKALQSTVPSLKSLKIIENTGHDVVTSKPGEVVDELTRILDL